MKKKIMKNKQLDVYNVTFKIVVLLLLQCVGYGGVFALQTNTKPSSLGYGYGYGRLCMSSNGNDVLAMEVNSDSELNALLETMPTKEKYSLLLQSYKTKIVQGRSGGDVGFNMDKMKSLYYEMLQKSVKADQQGSSCLIDSAASLLNVQFMSNAIRLVRLNGELKAFGALIGQLTTPTTKQLVDDKDALSGIASVKLPVDSREAEIASAGVVLSAGLIYVSMQVISTLASPDLHPWATLFGVSQNDLMTE